MKLIIKRLKTKKSLAKLFFSGIALLALMQFLPQPAFAATTGNPSLFRQVGSGSSSAVGDYVSATAANGGMNSFYQFFLEVPPGLTTMTVRIFDADIGRGTSSTRRHDWLQGGGYNTSCSYTLYTPTGALQATLLGSTTVGTNNGWTILATVATPVAGHWRLVSDMSSAVTAGDDCNGWGFDVTGAIGATSVEINAYAYSFVPVGELDQTGATTTTTLYPYITSDCSTNWKDFDGDNSISLCHITYRSRNGAANATYDGSNSTVWLNQTISGYESDIIAAETGIWTWTGTYTRTGAGGGNFGVFYAGNSGNAVTPPIAQPENNTFRIYLPRGSNNAPGGPPLKPVVTQKVSYISGPNPPSANQTTKLRIEIAVINLEAQAITFDASNLVTANIPGSGVVYAGNPSMSQGSIVSQPAVDGSGNLTWNPGTITGGNSYAALYYQVNVTPPSNGLRMPLTGVAASGTSAQFIDKTGTQAYLYGPLCELAATSGSGGTTIPTLAAISSFKAFMENGRAVVQWQTGSENGTAGYYLTRKDKRSGEFELVSPSFLPGLGHCPQGGVYRLLDDSAMYGETYEYQLLEVESQGGLRSHGPFKVTVGDQELNFYREEDPNQKGLKSVPTEVPGFSHMSFEPSANGLARLQARKLDKEKIGIEQQARRRGMAKIAIKEKGLYYIDASQIALWLGVSTQQAQSMIMYQAINLFNQKHTVHWLANQSQTGIYFYGEGIDNIYTDTNIYWLENEKGVSLKAINGGLPAPANENQTFQESVHFEEDHYALTALFDDPQADFFLWDYLVADEKGKEYKISVNGAAGSATATLTVAVKGATDTAANPDHHVRVSLNGTFIGESQWNGYEAHSFNLSFNQSLLNEGENSVELTGVLSSQTPYSIFYLESFDLSYQRRYRAVNDRLLCQGDGNQVITVDGFSDLNIMVWNITRPTQPKLVVRTTIDPTYKVSFLPSSPQSKYLVVSLSGIQTPVYAYLDQPSQLKKPRNSAEYVMIAPDVMVKTAQDLADYHARKGLTTMVVDLEDIYDEFNHGIANPWAIQNFLAYAYKNWNGKKPKYAVLTGKGTFDYKDCQGYGDNLMPPILAKTPDGLFAADNQFGDVTGKNGVPEIAIGRLPAVTVAELQTLIDKIKAYDNASGPWTGNIMLVADKPDGAGEFYQSSDSLASLMPGHTIAKIYHSSGVDPNETRDKIIAGFNSGASLVNYAGHAGLDYLSKDDIFNIEDVPSLANENELPIVTLLTCVAGRFEIPGFGSLSETLLLKSDGGAITALAPSGWSLNSLATSLAQEFFKAVYLQGIKDIGQAWLKAAAKYIAMGLNPYLLNIYNILGDPATVFK